MFSLENDCIIRAFLKLHDHALSIKYFNEVISDGNSQFEPSSKGDFPKDSSFGRPVLNNRQMNLRSGGAMKD